ncbi:MAG TPA: TldD/PmbA family protein [Candidatus Thermoplasmatota archaeon]|nr:TldD/PmbA family protein [Candidatus Thermoplasmatota archaeon]
MDPEWAVAEAVRLGARFADCRLESVVEDRVSVEDGEVRGVTSGSETGFAIRALVGDTWGFASSNDLRTSAVRDAVRKAVRLGGATKGSPVGLAEAPTVRASEVWDPRRDPHDVAPEDKLALLRDIEAATREVRGIHSVTGSVASATVRKTFADSEGRLVRWGLTRTVVATNVTARAGGRLQSMGSRVGGTLGWEIVQQQDPVAKAVERARSAVAALKARSPKGGRRTVVIDHELAGVFAHEAVGHAAEADLVASGESLFRGRIGERLGVEGLSIRDDSTIRGAFGSFPFDDNGVAGQSRPILEDGVLTGHLCDREHAHALGLRPTGSARADGFHSKPLVRMSNTLIAPGDVPEDEVFSGIREGVYCKGSRGGQVDCARGTFLFNAQEAYVIKDGELGPSLRDVSLTGDILSTLHNIDALGDTARMGDPGHCGKGQWVPVCDGGPLVRIRDCLVGGAG